MDASQIKRYLALLLYYGFAQWLPSRGPIGELSTRLRQELCKAFVAEAGAHFNIGTRVHLGTGRNVRIGDRSGLGSRSRVYDGVTIGDEVMFGPDCTILAQNHRFDRLDQEIGWQGKLEAKPPVIEDGAWIGLHVIILPGRVIGRGAIVGAGSVVTRDVAPYSIVGGNPAQVIGSRLPDEDAVAPQA
jgi:maltose O-acetyltransferase